MVTVVKEGGSEVEGEEILGVMATTGSATVEATLTTATEEDTSAPSAKHSITEQPACGWTDCDSETCSVFIGRQ